MPFIEAKKQAEKSLDAYYKAAVALDDLQEEYQRLRREQEAEKKDAKRLEAEAEYQVFVLRASEYKNAEQRKAAVKESLDENIEYQNLQDSIEEGQKQIQALELKLARARTKVVYTRGLYELSKDEVRWWANFNGETDEE